MLESLMTMLVPLVIITDPLGNLLFFLFFTKTKSPSEQRKVAALSSLTACVILGFFAVTGDFLLRFFHISLPAFQLAGGFVFFIYALQMMRVIPGGVKTTSEEEQEGITKENVALVPLATPLLAGPGAITAVLVWQQTPGTSANMVLLLTAIIITCLIIFITFYFATLIIRVMGVGGIRVVTRLMGLLLAVIAVQFMVSGYQQIR